MRQTAVVIYVTWGVKGDFRHSLTVVVYGAARNDWNVLKRSSLEFEGGGFVILSFYFSLSIYIDVPALPLSFAIAVFERTKSDIKTVFQLQTTDASSTIW